MFRNKFGHRKLTFAAIIVLAICTFATVKRSEALTLDVPVDHFIIGDTGIQSLLPLGVVTISDIAVNTVQFNVNLTPGVIKYVTMGLMLSPVINESQLTLNSLSGDQMTLGLGGWLSYFPIKVTFNQKPTQPVAFTLTAPGLDVTDFQYLPLHVKYGASLFALNVWYLQPNGGMFDSVVGGNKPVVVPGNAVPEPLTSLMLGSGLIGLGARRFRRNAA